MPTVSIIVPVYKVEPYLRNCIDSILAQSYTDYELILVDDGSPDLCGQICDEYALMDSRIRVIHKENGGLSSARNAGMELSTGKYILFCDSDDYVHPEWCRTLVEEANPSQNNYVFGGIRNITILQDGTSTEQINVPAYQRAEYSLMDFLRFHVKGQAGFGCNVLYYADILKKNGITFPTDVIIEDLPFNLQYLQHMDSLTYAGSAHYCYLHRSVTTLSKKYYIDGFRKYHEKYLSILQFINSKLPLAQREEAYGIVASNYLFHFLSSLANTFDKRNSASLRKKLSYNQHVIKAETFRHCLRYASSENEDQRYLFLLRQKNYYIAWFYQKLVEIKQKLFK